MAASAPRYDPNGILEPIGAGSGGISQVRIRNECRKYAQLVGGAIRSFPAYEGAADLINGDPSGDKTSNIGLLVAWIIASQNDQTREWP